MKPPSPRELRTAIREAARAAFQAIQRAHAREELYAFALYTNDSATLIAPSANTRQGLRKCARKYVGRSRDPGALAEQIESLRWSAPDWVCHTEGDDYFTAAEELLDARPSPVDIEDDDEARSEFDLRMRIFVDALKDLDAEGVFDKGRVRDKIVLLVLMGDQDQKLMLDCARKLNPHRVFKKFSA